MRYTRFSTNDLHICQAFAFALIALIPTQENAAQAQFVSGF